MLAVGGRALRAVDGVVDGRALGAVAGWNGTDGSKGEDAECKKLKRGFSVFELLKTFNKIP